MPLEVLCSRCQGRLLVEKAGVVVACPMCGTHLMVPLPKPAAPQATFPPVPPQTAALKPTPKSPTAKSNDSLKPQSDSIPDWLQAAQDSPVSTAPGGGLPSGFPQFGSSFPSAPPSAPSPFDSILTAPPPPAAPPAPAPAPMPVAQVTAPPAPAAPPPAASGLPFSFPGAGSPAPFPATAQPEAPFSFSFDQLTAPPPPPSPAPTPPVVAPATVPAAPVAVAPPPPPVVPAPVAPPSAPAPLPWMSAPMLQVTVPLPGEAATISPAAASEPPAPEFVAEQTVAESPTVAFESDAAAQTIEAPVDAARAPSNEEWGAPEGDATVPMSSADPWATQPGLVAAEGLAIPPQDDATLLETPALEPAAEPGSDAPWPPADAAAPSLEVTETFREPVAEVATDDGAQAHVAAFASVETIATGDVTSTGDAAAAFTEPPPAEGQATTVPSEGAASDSAEPEMVPTADVAPEEGVSVVHTVDEAPVADAPSTEATELAAAESADAGVIGAVEEAAQEAPAPAEVQEQPTAEPGAVESIPAEAVAPPSADLAAQAAMMAAAAAAPVGMAAPVTVAVATPLDPATAPAHPTAYAAPATAPVAATAAPVAATALPAEAVATAMPAEVAHADAGFLAAPASMAASPAARPAGRPSSKHIAVSQLWFVMILSYASAITVMILYLVFGAKFGTAHQLESLPDVVPKETPAGKIRTDLVSQGASMPPGHTLKLGQTERYGNLRVTPLRVVREPVEFAHYSDADMKKAPGETVLKLWMRFENMSKDQEFSPLGKELLFARHQTAMDRGRDRSNTFVCPLEKKRTAGSAVLVYQHSFNDVWDLKDLKIDYWVPPGETFETYIPTDPAGIDQLTGELVWRVHFRKGLNAKSGRGVTTMIEVVFNSDQIETPGATSEPAAAPPAEPEKKEPPIPTKA